MIENTLTPTFSGEKNSARALARLHFAQMALQTQLQINPASSDASFRSYWRVRDQAGQSHIVMDAPVAQEDCKPFIDICARLIAADLRGPNVLAQDLDQGFLLLRDLGTRTLLPELTSNTVDQHYQDAIAAILHMQLHVSAANLPSYDAPKLDQEMELFPTWFLRKHLRYQPTCEEFDLIEATFTQVRNSALAQPKVFVHRDFHSRNLMLSDHAKAKHQRLALIDFQDAVRGPISYDLVSLLRDCYIRWPEQQVYGWLESYRVQAVHAGLTDASSATFAKWFDFMGVQRHLKVLGIFARLNYRDGKSSYLKDLPLVLDYTLSVCRKHAELAGFADWLAGLCAGVDLTQAQP
jgi:N-acetylmuramate 1-kinase